MRALRRMGYGKGGAENKESIRKNDGQEGVFRQKKSLKKEIVLLGRWRTPAYCSRERVGL